MLAVDKSQVLAMGPPPMQQKGISLALNSSCVSNLSAFRFCNQLPDPPTSTLKTFKWLMFSGQAHLDNFPIRSSTVPYNIPRNRSKISCAQSQKSGKAYIPGIGNLGSHIRILLTVVRFLGGNRNNYVHFLLCKFN